MIQIIRIAVGPEKGIPCKLEIPTDGTFIPDFVRIDSSWYALYRFKGNPVSQKVVCRLVATGEDSSVIFPQARCLHL